MNTFAKSGFAAVLLAALATGCISFTEEDVYQQHPVIRPPATPMPVVDTTNYRHVQLHGIRSEDTFALITLPPYRTELAGHRDVRFRNSNDMELLIVVRSDKGGINMVIPPKSIGHVKLPDGGYRVEVVFKVRPNAIYAGDNFFLPTEEVPEIGLPTYLGE